MEIDILSLTWQSISKSIKEDKELFMSELSAKNIDPREADYLRGQINYINHLLAEAQAQEEANAAR